MEEESGQAILEFVILSAIVLVSAVWLFRNAMNNLPSQFANNMQSAIRCMSDYTRACR